MVLAVGFRHAMQSGRPVAATCYGGTGFIVLHGR